MSDFSITQILAKALRDNPFLGGFTPGDVMGGVGAAIDKGKEVWDTGKTFANELGKVKPEEAPAIAKATGTGWVGGYAGVPADFAVNAANLIRAAYGYGGHKLGLLDASQMPREIDPVDMPGTSDWITQQAGVGKTPGETAGLTFGSMLSPSIGGKTKAATKLGLRSGKELEQDVTASGYKGVFTPYQLDAGAKARRAHANDYLENAPLERYQTPEGILLPYDAWDKDIRPTSAMLPFTHIGADDPLKRYVGPRSVGRVGGILDDEEAHDIIVKAGMRGQEQGADFWYNLMPIYVAMRQAGGTDHDFARFIANNYSMSGQTSLLPNIAHATLATNLEKKGLITPAGGDLAYLQKRGLLEPNMTPGDTASALMRDYYKAGLGGGVGAKIAPESARKSLEFMGTGKFEQGFEDAQKIAGYGHGLAGFRWPVALDVHEIRMLSDLLPDALRAKFYKPTGELKLMEPTEYHAIERLYQDRLAVLAGVPPADFQAGRWNGGGGLTGLLSPPIPFVDAFERLVAWNAHQRGINPQKLMNDVLLGKDYLRSYNRSATEPLRPTREILR